LGRQLSVGADIHLCRSSRDFARDEMAASVLDAAKDLIGEGGPLEPVVGKVLAAATELDAWYEKNLGPVHPLTKDLPFMVPSIATAMAIGYLSFVIFVPILFRATGFSIKLKPVMRLYNLFMVVLSAWMGTKSIMLARESNDTVFCVPMAEGKAGAEMAQLVWIFTFSKVIEFLDTVFMIFEGRMRQVSFLHVYHHVSILAYWFTISWVLPGSDAYFSLAGNSYIHVLMYAYYLLASFGYSPWWKYYVRIVGP
jgi:GNS1/SUR4 family